MDVANVGLVHCDSCKYKVKGFFVVFSYKKKVQKSTCKDCNRIVLRLNSSKSFLFEGKIILNVSMDTGVFFLFCATKEQNMYIL